MNSDALLVSAFALSALCTSITAFAETKRVEEAQPHRVAVEGHNWTMQKQMTRLNKANGRIAYRFEARDLHLVMGPAVRGKPVRFRVLIDGKPPIESYGSDTDATGYGTASEERLYHLIRQRGPIEQRHFEIEFLDEGLDAYAFTFG